MAGLQIELSQAWGANIPLGHPAWMYNQCSSFLGTISASHGPAAPRAKPGALPAPRRAGTEFIQSFSTGKLYYSDLISSLID